MAKKGKYARAPEPKQRKPLFSRKAPPEEAPETPPEPQPQPPAVALKEPEAKKPEPKEAKAKKPEAKPPETQTPEEQPPETPLTPRQKAWNTAVTILTHTIMVVSVVMMLFTAISTRTLDQNDRDLFGYQFFIVRSDSMSATDFSAGDLVVIQRTDPTTLVEGDIIAFISADPNTRGETYTHKIRSFTADEFGERTFVTYGTTTGSDDIYPVPQENVLGKYRFAITGAGTFFAFMKTPMGYICCIGIPFLLMLLIQGGGMIASARGLYKEKEEAVEAAHQQELAARQETIDSQRTAIRKLYLAVTALQERVEALEKGNDRSL